MPGHMGQVRRTAQNLEIVQVRKEDNVLLIRGNCPGSEGDYIIVREAKKIANGSRRFLAIHAARKKAKEGIASKKDAKKGADAASAAKKK